jgi:hypothetical protein
MEKIDLLTVIAKSPNPSVHRTLRDEAAQRR